MSQINQLASNSTNNQSDLCVPALAYSSLWFNLVPILEILINVFVMVAALQSRRNLRHNYVYVYVINTLVANTCFGFVFAYEITSKAVYLERVWNSESPYSLNNEDSRHMIYKKWWAFRSSLTTCLFLVMSGSILALIYGIRESSYFVGRRLNQRTSENTLKTRTSPHRRTKMIIIIIINWSIPLICSIAVASGWSCAQYCFCIPGYYNPNLFYCQTDKYRHCSRYVLPITNSFILLIIIAWTAESVGIIYMLVTLIQKYLSITKPNRQNIDATHFATATLPPTVSSYSGARINTNMSDQRRNTINDKNDDAFKQSCFKFSSLSYHVKLLLVISILYIVLTFPSMALGVTDIASNEYVLSFYLVLLCTLSCVLYCCLSPLALVYYMPGLRLALRRILLNCTCCTKTTITVSTSMSSTTDL